MQTMIDALYPESILLDAVSRNAQIVAAYIDHGRNPDSYKQAVARFPTKKHIKISVRGTVGADVLDCEASTGITPQDCVTWVQKSRAAGKTHLTVYCNELSTAWGWPNVRKAFNDAHVAHPMYWVANYSRPPSLPDGAIGHQYDDLDANGHNTYDSSIMAEGWPFLLEDDMALGTDERQWLKDLHDWFAGGVAEGTLNKANELRATLEAVREIYNDMNVDVALDKAQSKALTQVLAQIAALQDSVSQLASGTGVIDYARVQAAAEAAVRAVAADAAT